jgi:hypothetical protein
MRRVASSSALLVCTPSCFMPRTVLPHPARASRDRQAIAIRNVDIVAPPRIGPSLGPCPKHDTGKGQINSVGTRKHGYASSVFRTAPHPRQLASKNKSSESPITRFIKPNEFKGCSKIKIIKLDCMAPATYLSLGRYLLDDFGFCDIERNRTNFPSDSNIKPRCNITAWFTIIC